MKEEQYIVVALRLLGLDFWNERGTIYNGGSNVKFNSLLDLIQARPHRVLFATKERHFLKQIFTIN